MRLGLTLSWGNSTPKRESAERQRSVSEITVKGMRVELLRKEIKNLHLRVHPPDGRVSISVPRQLPIRLVVALIEERLEWIRAQQLRLSTSSSPIRFTDGERHLIAGDDYVLRVVECSSHFGARVVAPDILEIRARAGSTIDARGRMLDAFYRSEVLMRAAPFFARWERVLGVQASEWRVRKMSTRWGSCNVAAKRVWLSLELAKKPDDCLEYVVVHELAHLLEAGHGPRFVSCMDKSLPDWRARKRKLNSR